MFLSELFAVLLIIWSTETDDRARQAFEDTRPRLAIGGGVARLDPVEAGC